MEFLSLVVSVTSRRNIVSKYITDPVLLPNFALGDTFSGRIAVVSETKDPTAPTLGVPVTGSSNIALTDGASVIYAQATAISVQNGNELVFTMTVDGAALRAEIADDAFLPAYFEIRAGLATGQDELIAVEPVVIVGAVTRPPGNIAVAATESLVTTGHA